MIHHILRCLKRLKRGQTNFQQNHSWKNHISVATSLTLSRNFVDEVDAEIHQSHNSTALATIDTFGSRGAIQRCIAG
jgi:hypothetical protein